MEPPGSKYSQRGKISRANVVFGDQKIYSDRSDSSYRNVIEAFGSECDYDQVHHEIKKPHDQTCSWSQHQQDIRSWADDNSSLMWLVGGPGIGKTVLAKYLIKSLQQDGDKGKRTIYFFCDRQKKKDGSKAVFILRSLIYQCMTIAEYLGKRHVKPRYDTYGPHLLKSNGELAKLFFEMMSDPGLGEWYCIIDALDDCEDQETKTLLEGIVAESQGTDGEYPRFLRLLITSRPCGAVRSAILNRKNVRVVHFTDPTGKQLNEADIADYISDHVRQFEHYPEEKKPGVEKQLIEKAGGNFTWTISMIHQLGNKSPDWYNKLLAEIPSGMETMVERIVHRAKPESLLLIQLLAVVQRPLSVTELATLITMKGSPFDDLFALVRTTSAMSIRDKIRFGEESLKICDDEILFFHPSMPKQLHKTWTEDVFREMHLKVAEACLIYLISIDDSHKPLQGRRKADCGAEYQTVLGALPLLEYAAAHWPTHLHCAGPDSADRLWPLLEQSLSCETKRELSFQVYRFWHHDDYVEGQSPLHILVLHNLRSIVRRLFAGDLQPLPLWDVNARDSTGRPPLWWAVTKRHKDMVSLLLNNKSVDCNIRDHDAKISPPVLAIKRGFTDIVRLFLETDSNRISWSRLKSNGRTFTALYWAAISKFEDLVLLLLTRKEFSQDLEERCASQTPLVAAARNGYSEIVMALLRAGARRNSTDDDERLSALSWAARNGQKEVVDCLLRYQDVDIYLRDPRLDRNAFQWAAAHRHEEIASRILAEMYTRWGNQAQPRCISLLLEAAERSQLGALNILLRRDGLMPDSTHRPDGRTALSLAAENGQTTVVQRLMGKDTEVNSVDRDGKTPLMWAADKGHVEVVEVLLESERVYVDAVDSSRRTAYDWALKQGRFEVCKLLTSVQRPLEHRRGASPGKRPLPTTSGLR
ncbi:hypothetical protein CLCR_11257 [Cladophialophora carrionii]|uniref:NACHT domain-containing protein n=1 Tax=Cladophialophora carrionii TaxID=86049 RepID=A0A1C1CF75_9EURO|nr:hypothetical protein CLCR_11257 [Cladophialophora carrionii]